MENTFKIADNIQYNDRKEYYEKLIESIRNIELSWKSSRKIKKRRSLYKS